MSVARPTEESPVGADYHWTSAALRAGRLEFDRPSGLHDALSDGFFFVEQPAELELTAGDRFADNFYRPVAEDDDYRGFRRWNQANVGPRQGFFERADDQTEQFFLESAWWRQLYPPALCRQAGRMRDYAIAILVAVLAELELPRQLWNQATGGAVSGAGSYHLTFNHFRPQVAARGLNIHKDSGWVTLLRSVQPGLEVLRRGEWQALDPRPGCFIVNFGCAMEILTARCRLPVAAVAHRVRQQPDRPGAADRFSYALFVDSSLDEQVCPGLFSYQPATGLRFEMNFGQFLSRIVDDTYRPDTTGLY